MEPSSNIEYYLRGCMILYGDSKERNGQIVCEIFDLEWAFKLLIILNKLENNDDRETITKHIDSGKR